MNLVPTLVVVVVCISCCSAQTYYISCDTIADGCDSGFTYSVENFIASFSTDITGSVTFTFGGDLTVEGFSNATNYITSVSSVVGIISYPAANFMGAGGMVVGALTVSNSDFLVSFDGLEGVTISSFLFIYQNSVLESLSGINATALGNDLTLTIIDNPALVDWTALSASDGQIGNININNNNATREIDFNFIINGDISISNMGSMTTLSKLTLSTSTNHVSVVLRDLPSLTDFGGFEANGHPLDFLYIQNLPKVDDWDWTGFNFSNAHTETVSMFVFTNVGGHINFDGTIDTRPMFFVFESTGIRNFDNLFYNASDPFVGGVTLTNNPDLTSISGLRGIGANSGGDEQFYVLSSSLFYASSESYEIDVYQLLGVTIENNPALASLDGLQDVDVVVGELRICGNDALTSLDGLENLASVRDQPNIYSTYSVFNSYYYPATFQGYLRVCDNANLEYVSLPALDLVEGFLSIDNNPSLSYVDLPLLEGSPPPGANYSVHGFLNVTGFAECADCSSIAAVNNIVASGPTNIDNCTVYADACAANPCLHGGVCIDDFCDDTSYTCNCTGTGWPLGTHCNTTVCGDGILAGNETCDDGNTNNGDGCESDCTLTTYTSSSTSTSSSSSSSSSTSSSSTAEPTTTTATTTADTTSPPDDTPTTSTEEEVMGTSDAGQIEADRRARARRIGAAVGGSLGGLCLIAICVAIGVATGMGGTMVRDSGKVSATADEEMGSYSHSNDSAPSSSSASAPSTSVDPAPDTGDSADSSAEASES